ncbi:TetR/AcrR family transcriptional regulator C-terminal ligand-binding domain-containing protein [Nocardia puris]|uniref:TetR family transcriptional regulator n=1 Tax=Nocardia puris TaxID=208602 RepID=A0A366DMY7_9NOCA|nr:TetR-like C-terminal domain-containing protein [Nocardia puris]MBF6211318.1 TetR/AcrR family transcriptional regulator C-terminal ligand-binding domain-containing protein [Nocardia puris]MBF6365037.1 TetR/AcrR family transcriptional regulator C-terminal ligand-binding domain-containing protein [Nocardia puris]MBF6458822.1 TetR/AcrR family transcriptional regulator C-terminal ligand-binding domain-containing protein [Nocardia puris]RBO90674.1 TetR family transcriptional regulator [Nocardia pu
MVNPTPQLRGARLRRAVLDATVARIEADGIDHVRVADIAADAGVHETSIYRRWKTLTRLLLDALLSRVDADIPIPDTGSVRTDLEEFTRRLMRFGASPFGAALIRGAGFAGGDPETTETRREFWIARLAASEEIVRRAIARGELPPTADPRMTLLTLGGLVHMYVTQFDGAMPPDLAERAVELVLSGLLPR